jgi:hypothetical protein
LSVKYLLVEGNLDREILASLLGGSPTVKLGGGKYGLKPQAVGLSSELEVAVRFIRDRDFDFDPPSSQTQPCKIEDRTGSLWGWYWCRHEIENYLLEPEVVVAADPRTEQEEYKEQLRAAALSIRSYQCARWAVGTAKRSMPPIRALETRPSNVVANEFTVPEDWSPSIAREWAVSQTSSFLTRVENTLNADTIRSDFDSHLARFDEDFCQDLQLVLLWFSGKDLLAALAPWISGRYSSPGNFRAVLRDWCRKNPEDALRLIPEWQVLVGALRGE